LGLYHDAGPLVAAQPIQKYMVKAALHHSTWLTIDGRAGVWVGSAVVLDVLP
jgi:hypothetical protein